MILKRFWFIPLILMLAIAACSPAGTEPAAPPPGNTEEAQQVAEDALPAAREALADYLEVSPEAIEAQQIEDAEWPNACLGLAQSGEMCAEVITPGYLITFMVEGQPYAVRTDLDGNAVRVESAAGAPTPADELSPAVEAARAALARQLDMEPAAVEVLSFERREWSDSCLGLGGPAESCAAVITPGWQVMLGVQGQAYEVRTDESGQQVRVAEEADEDSEGPEARTPPGPELNGAVLFYQRSGGIAGEILTVRAYPDGTVERIVGPPEPETPVEAVLGDADAVETLLAELEAAGYFELDRSHLPQDTCCDRILYLLSVQEEEAEEAHTVEALGGTPDMPPALGQSIDLIEEFIAEAFGR